MFYVFPENLHAISIGGKEYNNDVTGGADIPVAPEVVIPFGLVPGEPKLPLKKTVEKTEG